MASSMEFVEDMLEKHGLLNRPRKIKTRNGETLARYRWRLLYNAIKESAGEAIIEENSDHLVSHGIKFLRKLSHQKPITEMYFIREKNLLLTVDDEMIRSFKPDGSRRDIIAKPKGWSRLVYASHTDQFVAWSPHSLHILLLRSDTFEIITGSEAEDPVHQVLYNVETEEIITSHENYLQLWVFRYGNRHLLPRRKISTAEPRPSDSPPVEQNRMAEVDEPGTNSKCVILTLFAREATRSPDQRLFAVSGSRGVRCFSLHRGLCTNYFRKLHRRQLTAISFFNPLKLLATGSADGSLKLWHTSGQEQQANDSPLTTTNLALYTIFVGHSAAIHCIDVYPFECSLLSVAADHTLRVWSLEAADEVECRSLNSQVKQVIVHADNEFFYTRGDDEVSLWQAYVLARQHALLQDEVREAILIPHYNYSGDEENSQGAENSCVLLLMKKGLCHIVDTVSGSVVCSAVARDSGKGELHRVISADCSPILQRLFTLADNGTLTKFSLTTNPCQMTEWVSPDRDDSFLDATRLCIYEHRFSIKRPPTGHSFHPASAGYRDTRDKLESKTRVILFSGHSCGQVKCYDLDQSNNRDGDRRGCHQLVQSIDAHDRRPVLTIIAHPTHSQLLTSGEDNVIRVWRVFPYTREHLEPLLSFYCSHRPVALASFKQTMLACFDDFNSANYSTVVYHIDDRDRHDHAPDLDHMDTIKGVTACRQLKLFATTSLDGTVRIWNERNRLVRILQFHGLVDTVTFATSKGDLLVTIHKTLFLVRHQHYLPKSYIRRLIMLGIHDSGKMMKSLPLNERILAKYSPAVVHSLKEVKSAFKYVHYSDEIAQEVLQEMDKEKREKEEAFARLAQREEEIRKIRDGEIKAKITRFSTVETRDNAFRRYLETFYEAIDSSLPADPYDEEKVLDALEGKLRKYKEPRALADQNADFFPLPPVQKKDRGLLEKLRGGYLPNSALMALLLPPQLVKEKSDSRKPILTSNDISFLAAQARKREAEDARSETSEGTRFFNWDDEEEETTPLAIFDDETKKPEEPPKPEEQESDFMAKMKGILEKESSVSNEEAPEKELTSQTVRSESEVAVPSPRRTPTSVMKTFKPEDVEAIKRMRSTASSSASSLRIKRQTTSLTETIEEAAQGQEQSPTATPILETPRIKTPSVHEGSDGGDKIFLTEVEVRGASPTIPEFLQPLMEEEWFQRLFAQTNVFEYFQQPFEVSNVAYLLAVRMGEVSSWRDKKSLLQAILSLHQREVLTSVAIVKIKNYQLQTLAQEEIDIGDRSQRYFLENLFKFWASMDMHYSDVLVELLTWYFDVDDAFQSTINDVLTYLGMLDPQNYVFKELDSWKLFDVREESRKEDLRRTVCAWLEKWLRAQQIAAQEAAAQGKALKSSPRRPRAAAHTGRSNTSQDTATTGGGRERGTSQISMDLSTEDSSSDYWDALLYFIAAETKKQEEIIRSRRAAAAARKAQFSNEEEGLSDDIHMKRNTVLVLPEIPAEKQFLVRLGESHADALKLRKRYQPTLGILMEKDHSQPAALQPLRSYQQALAGGFVPYLHLPLKQCPISPFPNAMDEKEWRETFEPEMLTLRLSNKFFLPAFSCPPKPF